MFYEDSHWCLEDNLISELAGYRIYRLYGRNWYRMAALGSVASSFLIRNTLNSMEYRFAVTAVNEAGQEGKAAIITVK
jgi:hypothetical protein